MLEPRSASSRSPYSSGCFTCGRSGRRRFSHSSSEMARATTRGRNRSRAGPHGTTSLIVAPSSRVAIQGHDEGARPRAIELSDSFGRERAPRGLEPARPVPRRDHDALSVVGRRTRADRLVGRYHVPQVVRQRAAKTSRDRTAPHPTGGWLRCRLGIATEGDARLNFGRPLQQAAARRAIVARTGHLQICVDRKRVDGCVRGAPFSHFLEERPDRARQEW